MQWLMEHVHFTAVRDRFGLCLPVLLQVLDCCSESTVRLVGLDALHLMLDRAMAAEVQSLVPPLEHCLTSCSPIFLNGDTVAPSVVAPLCASHVLFLLKAYPCESLQRQDMIQSLLTFGGV